MVRVRTCCGQVGFQRCVRYLLDVSRRKRNRHQRRVSPSTPGRTPTLQARRPQESRIPRMVFQTTGTNAYQSVPASGSSGTSHVYVSVLDSTGSVLKYSSYLSGNGTDTASGMTIDNKGNLFVTGTTTSSDQSSTSDAFPAAGPPTSQQPPFQVFHSRRCSFS